MDEAPIRLADLPETIRDEVQHWYGRSPQWHPRLPDDHLQRLRASWNQSENGKLVRLLPPMLGWMATVGTFGFAATSAGAANPASYTIPGVLAVVAFGLSLPAIARRRDPKISVRELATIEPLLRLDANERTYLKAAMEAHGAEGSAEAQRALPTLRKLLDSEERMRTLEEELPRASSARVATEIAEIEREAAQARDPEAKRALAASADLARARLDRTERAEEVRERIRAHRILLRQQFLAVSESLARPALGGGHDLAALREGAEETARELVALESAVRELRAL